MIQKSMALSGKKRRDIFLFFVQKNRKFVQKKMNSCRYLEKSRYRVSEFICIFAGK